MNVTQNAIRILSAGIAVTAVAGMLLANPAPEHVAATFDPSVPSASQVFSANDGRHEGNVEDKTY